jgi:hypothetical protein
MLFGALVVLSAAQQTDTTFAVQGAQVLHVDIGGGSITVQTWDRDEVRVQAEHSTRTFVQIERGARVIQVEAEARRGPANIVDFQLTVPRALGLDLETQYGDVTVEGSDAAVAIETLRGDITLRGGRGTVELSSTMGAVSVEGAAGQIEIESSAADIAVTNSSGIIYAESAGGNIVLQNVTSTTIDVGSTGGRVYYSGTFDPAGTYFLGAHGGSVTIVVPEGAAATFNLATVHNSITSNLSGAVQTFAPGERHTLQVGGGGALVEAETYGGRIRLLRAGSEGSEPPAPSSRDQGLLGAAPWDFDFDFDFDYDFDFDDAFDYDYDFDFAFDQVQIDWEPVRIPWPPAATNRR